uniref:Sema domain-containing protein n=1 Tax=Ascaris lumbricoides TaxID=6252 RepID=A0A9J2Q4U3_ASCLU
MIFLLPLVLWIISPSSINVQFSFVAGDTQSSSSPIQTKRSYAGCFGTSRFLFVGFANCHLTSERSPPPGMCPYHTLYQASTYSSSQWNCARVQIHLLLATDEEPRVLIIGASRDFGHMVAHIKAINWPKDNPGSSYRFHKELIDIESAHNRVSDILYANVITTIFDNHYRILYVLRNSSSYMSTFAMECVMFLIDVTIGGEVNFTGIGAFEVHSNNDRRTLWTQDPYTRKFYYAERSIHDERMLIYSVHFRQLMRVLIDGHAGSLERILLGTRIYLSVSKGIAVSYSNTHDVVRQYIHRINDTSEVILCEHESTRSHLDPTAQLIILFGEDYCKVKVGKSIVRNCEEEMSTTISSLNDKEKTESSPDRNIFWFLPIVIILCAVVLVLIIYIVRRRRQDELRSFLKADRPHVQYYPTFISDSSVDF